MSDAWMSQILETGRALAAYRASWAITGGWALDLSLNRPTRTHADIDVAI